MILNAEVYLWGTRIGIVHQDEASGIISFEYDKDFNGYLIFEGEYLNGKKWNR